MSGWRDTLKVEGIPPGTYTQYPHNPHNRHDRGKTALTGGDSADTAYSAYRTPTPTLPVVTPKQGQPMAVDVTRQLAADSERLFLRLWRRTAIRFNCVMRPGYLTWTQSHEPELWRRREATRTAWDDPAVYQDFQACRIPWAEYRRRVYAWARVEVEAIRRHREYLGGVKRHAA
jgi:hypothetical protein